MAKQIIILERLNEPSDMTFRYALWATVPAARVSFYATATATTAFKNASSAELLSIQNGEVVERVEVFQAPAGATISQIQLALRAAFTSFQAEISSRNPSVRYGTFWDGTSWTAAGTA